MGASASKRPLWYPGEPSEEGAEHDFHDEDACSRPLPVELSGDVSRFTITAQCKRAGVREIAAGRNGAGDNARKLPSAAGTAVSLAVQVKRAERDIKTLPVFDLSDMKVGTRYDRTCAPQGISEPACSRE